MLQLHRQTDNYDRLEAVGGEAAVKDVYIRTPGQKEWWLVRKNAHIPGISYSVDCIQSASMHAS